MGNNSNKEVEEDFLHKKEVEILATAAIAITTLTVVVAFTYTLITIIF